MIRKSEKRITTYNKNSSKDGKPKHDKKNGKFFNKDKTKKKSYNAKKKKYEYKDNKYDDKKKNYKKKHYGKKNTKYVSKKKYNKKPMYKKKKVNKVPLKVKLYLFIQDNFTSNNNGNGKVYINMLKGLEKTKRIAFSKDCKMEKIFYIVYLNKDGYIEVDKMHFAKPDMKFRKIKSFYTSGTKINFNDFNKSTPSEHFSEEENEIKILVGCIEKLVASGCFITSLPKKKEECKEILNAINEHINQ